MKAVRVALVGAGPGEPDLLTLRAEAELAAAATVVADVALEDLVRRFAPRADLVVVPDERPATSFLLAAVARADGDVVRLYAGDPWLHPAHGAELTALDRAGIASEPVAGVATEVAAPALAGIAVHVRHLAVACTIGPADAMPLVLDPARTLVVLTDDVGTAATRLGTGDDSDIPAAVVPLDQSAAAVRGILAEISSGAPAGRCLLVVGAVAEPDGAPGEAAGLPAARPDRTGTARAASRTARPATEQEAPSDQGPHRATGPLEIEDEASSWRASAGDTGFPEPDEPGGPGCVRSHDEGTAAGTGDQGRGPHGRATSDRTAGGGR